LHNLLLCHQDNLKGLNMIPLIAIPVIHSSGAFIASSATGYLAGTLSSTWLGAFLMGNAGLLAGASALTASAIGGVFTGVKSSVTGVAASLGLISTTPAWVLPAAIVSGVTLVATGGYAYYKRLIIFSLSIFFLVTPSSSYGAETRLSSSDICHEKGISQFFGRTSAKHTFSSVQECLGSIETAKLPKGIRTSDIKDSTKEAKEKWRSYSDIYNRKDWPHWKRNVVGCMNTRHALLRATSLVPVKGNKCNVKTGKWYGVYTGKTFTLSSDVDIDHVVPLKASHIRGGYAWGREKKEAFANDFENLLVVDDSTNQEKGAKMPTQWMPPKHEYRCQYLFHVDKIMKKYQLNYLQKEERTIINMIEACSK
jgi:hypothetical protein